MTTKNICKPPTVITAVFFFTYDRHLSYTLTKNSPESSYVLLAMSDVEETALQEAQMEVWRHYMEKHHKYWLKYIRKKWLDPNFKAENLVLLCGVIKSSSWVIATLPKEGVYRLDIQDSPVGLQPTLTIGGKSVANGLRYGQDTVEGDRKIIQHFARLAGVQVSDNCEPTRKRCLFLKGLRVEKDFWLPKRVVAAAEPRDPRSKGGDEFELSPLTLTSDKRCDCTCEDRRFSYRCDPEATLPATRHLQVFVTARSCGGIPNSRSSQVLRTTHSLTRAPLPLGTSSDYTPRHFHCSSPAPETTSFPSTIFIVAF